MKILRHHEHVGTKGREREKVTSTAWECPSVEETQSVDCVHDIKNKKQPSCFKLTDTVASGQRHLHHRLLTLTVSSRTCYYREKGHVESVKIRERNATHGPKETLTSTAANSRLVLVWYPQEGSRSHDVDCKGYNYMLSRIASCTSCMAHQIIHAVWSLLDETCAKLMFPVGL